MKILKTNRHDTSKYSVIPIRVYILYFALATFLITGVTFSRYVTRASGESSVSVLPFGRLTLTEDGNNTTVSNTVDDAGNINQKYMIIPGADLVKRATVAYTPSALAPVSPIYIFVSVRANNWQRNGCSYAVLHTGGKEFLNFDIDHSWIYLNTDNDGTDIYYRTASADSDFLADIIYKNTISVSSEIGNADMDYIKDKAGSVNFECYAVQASGFTDAEQAWESLKAKRFKAG